MLAYVGFFVFVAAAWGPVLLGLVLVVGLGAWSAVHIARGRPAWYVGKILKGGVAGALASGVLILSIDELGFLWPWPFAVAAGAGYGALTFAKVYFADRLSRLGPPL